MESFQRLCQHEHNPSSPQKENIPDIPKMCKQQFEPVKSELLLFENWAQITELISTLRLTDVKTFANHFNEI